MVTSGDTKLKSSFAGGLKLASLKSQLPIVKYVPFVANAVTATMDNVVEDIIARRRTEKGPVKKDIVQIILDANEADPIHFPEQRVRDEIKLFM
jgi:cytochrome P450